MVTLAWASVSAVKLTPSAIMYFTKPLWALSSNSTWASISAWVDKPLSIIVLAWPQAVSSTARESSVYIYWPFA